MTQAQRLHKLVRDVHTSLGGRASTDEIADAVFNAIPADERDVYLIGHLKTVISQALREKGSNGLAFAQAISGTYVQLSLMDEAEYRFVVRQHAKLASNHRHIAQKYVAHCLDHLGVDISDELSEAA